MNSVTDVRSEELAVGQLFPGVAQLDRNESTHRAERNWEATRLLEIAMDFRQNGWPDKASRFARRALAIFERELGPDDPDVVRVLLCLAGSREDLADYARAETEYRQANDILGRLAADPYDVEVQRLRIQTIRGLVNVTRALGRECDAETMLKQALAMAKRSGGWKHADVAGVLNDLGTYYRHIGQYEKASRVYRRALAIAEKALGPAHPLAAAILHNLGVLAHARGQFAVGESFARRAVSIRVKTLGPDHPQVAAGLVVIAALLEGQGNYDEAESMYRRALMMLGRWLGPDHREVAIAANHLARVFDRALDQRLTKRATGDVRCA